MAKIEQFPRLKLNRSIEECVEIVKLIHPSYRQSYSKPIGRYSGGLWHIQFPFAVNNGSVLLRYWQDIAYPDKNKQRAWNLAAAAVEGSSLYGVKSR